MGRIVDPYNHVGRKIFEIQKTCGLLIRECMLEKFVKSNKPAALLLGTPDYL